MKVSPISNDLIQAFYLWLNEDRTLRDGYFTDRYILSIQNYNNAYLNKYYIVIT